MVHDERPHIPVLLDEVLASLQAHEAGVYMDCTFGRGGHTRALLERVGTGGRVLVLDKDPEAVKTALALAATEPRLAVRRGSFAGLAQFAQAEGVAGRLDGVLFDLGVSSPQLDDATRGFSFSADGPLDMRMDTDSGLSAAAWLHRASERQIAEVIRTYGEERHARRIARAIVGARRRGGIQSTGRLAEIVARAAPSRERGKHPATRTFQAIRIFINRELDELKEALRQVIDVLAPGGRLAVISFHSLEDRLVKRFIRAHSRGEEALPGLPLPASAAPPPLRALGRAVRPRDEEIRSNPRARSAVLRVAEKRR